METQLALILHMNPRFEAIMPPIFLTQAKSGQGVDELIDAVRVLESRMISPEFQLHRKDRIKTEFEEILKQSVSYEWKELLVKDTEVEKKYAEVIEGNSDPYTMLREIYPDGVLNRR